MTDEQAMWRVQMQDDPEAFAILVRRWEAPVLRLGMRFIGDRHRAEDIVQESFARVFTHRRRFDPAARFSTWLWRIAINLCRDELRRRQRHPETSLDASIETEEPRELATDQPNPAEQTQSCERAEAVQRALLNLPEPYRLVVALRHYEGLRFADIAEVLGIPEGTAKSRMSEALDRLGRMLGPWHGPTDATSSHSPS